MTRVADSFAWPFRGTWGPKWVLGVIGVLLMPLFFVPLLGYAIAATREAERDPSTGPPAWHLSSRLVTDGIWTSVAILIVSLPFAVGFNVLSSWLIYVHLYRSSDPAVTQLFAQVLAICILALPFGLVLLLLMPNATAAYAASGRPRDLFDPVRAVSALRHDFPTWNLAAAAIVTAWAIGLACGGFFCIGLVPGVFYAILVSAHASAALQRQGDDSSTG
ncbi:MAG: DUF4013 domain-containing protein [Candidatus Dormibacterales bacterium]